MACVCNAQDKNAATDAAQALEAEVKELREASGAGGVRQAALEEQAGRLRAELAAARAAAAESDERERAAEARARQAGADLASTQAFTSARIAELSQGVQVTC